jgi:hypothetical protein
MAWRVTRPGRRSTGSSSLRELGSWRPRGGGKSSRSGCPHQHWPRSPDRDAGPTGSRKNSATWPAGRGCQRARPAIHGADRDRRAMTGGMPGGSEGTESSQAIRSARRAGMRSSSMTARPVSRMRTARNGSLGWPGNSRSGTAEAGRPVRAKRWNSVTAAACGFRRLSHATCPIVPVRAEGAARPCQAREPVPDGQVRIPVVRAVASQVGNSSIRCR